MAMQAESVGCSDSFSVYHRAKEEYIIVDDEVRTSVRQDKLE